VRHGLLETSSALRLTACTVVDEALAEETGDWPGRGAGVVVAALSVAVGREFKLDSVVLIAEGCVARGFGLRVAFRRKKSTVRLPRGLSSGPGASRASPHSSIPN
jgi:hypothetical protein